MRVVVALLFALLFPSPVLGVRVLRLSGFAFAGLFGAATLAFAQLTPAAVSLADSQLARIDLSYAPVTPAPGAFDSVLGGPPAVLPFASGTDQMGGFYQTLGEAGRSTILRIGAFGGGRPVVSVDFAFPDLVVLRPVAVVHSFGETWLIVQMDAAIIICPFDCFPGPKAQ